MSSPISSDSVEISLAPSRESELLQSSVSFPDPNAIGQAPASVISGDLRHMDEEKDGVTDLARGVDSAASDRPRLSRVPTRSSVTEVYSADDPSVFHYRLPPAFTGVKNLQMPGYVKGSTTSVTLPSRLELLGNRRWKIVAAMRPFCLGNSILGYAPVLRGKWFGSELFLLPWTFSKSAAKLALFVRCFFFLLCVLLGLMATGAVRMNVGKVWPLGAIFALYTIYQLAGFKRVPDGIIPFCEAIGKPVHETYMFSYSWKVCPDEIRTLAKALVNTGVSVWIDVVKLTVGEAIRSRLRTTIKKVFRIVIFLSPEYVASPNCCVEALEAVQNPHKLVVCVLKPVDPTIMEFFRSLPGITIVEGFPSLVRLLDSEVRDPQNSSFFSWWRDQRISGSGVPENVVPTSQWTRIPKLCFWARPIVPQHSLCVGGLYLSGDCTQSGYRFVVPWLLLLTCAGVAINTADIITKYESDEGNRQNIDYTWLCLIAICNLAPFVSFKNLYETRRDLSVSLKPLLASKSMGAGVKVRVVGESSDPIVQNLRNFLKLIGHNPTDELNEEEREERHREIKQAEKLGKELATGAVDNADNSTALSPPTTFKERIVTVYVMNSLKARDDLFGSDNFPFDRSLSLFVWSGPRDPFSKDEIGRRVMRFLVLVASWEKKHLADRLFSAIGIRVVDALHAD